MSPWPGEQFSISGYIRKIGGCIEVRSSPICRMTSDLTPGCLVFVDAVSTGKPLLQCKVALSVPLLRLTKVRNLNQQMGNKTATAIHSTATNHSAYAPLHTSTNCAVVKLKQQLHISAVTWLKLLAIDWLTLPMQNTVLSRTSAT